jgi:hypothetical protein
MELFGLKEKQSEPIVSLTSSQKVISTLPLNSSTSVIIHAAVTQIILFRIPTRLTFFRQDARVK